MQPPYYQEDSSQSGGARAYVNSGGPGTKELFYGHRNVHSSFYLSHDPPLGRHAAAGGDGGGSFASDSTRNHQDDHPGVTYVE